MSPKSKGRQRKSGSRPRTGGQPRRRQTRHMPGWLSVTLAVGAVVLVVAGIIAFVATRPSAKRASTQADAISAGKKVYVERCAICHGREGDGSAMGPPMFSGELAALSDDAYRTAIKDGVPNRRPQYGAMPPQTMSSSEAAHVIAYIRSAQRGPG